jgi:hypothetical protein
MTERDAAIRAQVRQLIKMSWAEAKPVRPADLTRPKVTIRLSLGGLMRKLGRFNKKGYRR